ncbi:glycosyltransferase [Tatumella sp. JGM130]|uniref:glycosyltransferase n=1 Tax=Tatumella sp. JGM130 TaxID=2799797 RepID=UPI001BB00CF4|nr:glycosyltransferase [Tatumella sp. JGM130]MBS0894957.1 glycosyltransferase [Tatumella sp. JGM130]
MPIVTVYITTCNRIELLKRCLQSIREQTVKDIEIIVVDDNSNDETTLYMESVLLTDSRVKYIKNRKGMGACYSRNYAIKIANSEYITGCDDDDYFESRRIENFLENKELLNEYSFIYTDSLWLNGSKITSAGINKFAKNEVCDDDLLYFNFIGNQVFCKTKMMRKYFFDDGMPAWQDLELWYRILRSEKNKGIRIQGYNYIQDIGHGYSRISLSKESKVKKAYSLFIDKYNLNNYERSILRSHFFNYGMDGERILITSFFLILKKPSFFKVLLLIRNIKEYIKNAS